MNIGTCMLLPYGYYMYEMDAGCWQDGDRMKGGEVGRLF